jgi:hypothetical protein
MKVWAGQTTIYFRDEPSFQDGNRIHLRAINRFRSLCATERR